MICRLHKESVEAGKRKSPKIIQRFWGGMQMGKPVSERQPACGAAVRFTGFYQATRTIVEIGLV
jgi:hypothetical protein